MSEEEVCQSNQTDFCMFRHRCRKIHINEICQEEGHCTSKECSYRHPKDCRTKGICQYGNDCAYKHKKGNNQTTENKEVTLKHDADICAMKKELHQLKVLIMQLANQVGLLNQEIQTD